MIADTFFLDNNVWNNLIESNQFTEEQLGQARQSLVEGVQQREWEVVCSLPVLQEAMRTHRENPLKYEAMKKLIFDVVGNKWLFPLNERYVAELYNGGRLPHTTRYISRDKRRQIERLVNSKKDIFDIGEAAYKEGLTFKRSKKL
ncbi:MAG TPA: hypothetical protein VD907_06380 [Verrucomicrobiae bacterium]|nr:hypothetical protein [Verrucomicrobiae bacterium]